MASLLKRTIKGHVYYYYVQSQRVNGRVRTHQTYLGSAEKILQRCQNSETSVVDIQHRAFGEVAALFGLCQRLRLSELINQEVSSALPVGEYLVLAALNRCVAPASKNKIQEWYRHTVLPDLLPLAPVQVTSQRFWDAMEAVDEAALARLETRLWRRVTETFSFPWEALVFDTTNFFTYIQDAVRGDLPRRGHNKAGKHELNQVGLGLVVSKVYGLPLLHQTYAGNQHDATVFPQVLSVLADRYARLVGATQQLTLLFDKGMNSQENLAALTGQQIHFIGSLVPSQFPDLLRIQARRYQAVTLRNGKTLQVFATQKDVFGSSRKVVVSYNAETAAKQEQVLQRHLQEATSALLEVHWNRVKQSDKKVADVLSHYRVKDVLQVTFTGKEAQVSINRKELRARQNAYGKTLLFTDQQDWSATEIVQAFHDKGIVEEDFRHLNDPQVVSFHPVYHWTDTKIRVHAFTCVVGLLLWRCLQMQATQAGLTMSLPVLREELKDVQAVLLIDAAERITAKLSHRSGVQQKLFELFGLTELAQQAGFQL
jgi:transposase